MSKKKSQTDNQVDWEEIFESIDIDYLPIEYIDKVIIKFNDGTIWDIDVSDSRKKQPIEEIENSIDTLIEQYDEHIQSIDFRLDFPRVKHDLSRRVSKFLKLNR